MLSWIASEKDLIMEKRAKYNNLALGFMTGFILPVIVFLIVMLVSRGERTPAEYFGRLVAGDILTHFISLCVFPNLFSFLLFNRLDYLDSSKGVLGMTIIWALLTFIIKFTL